MGVLYIYIIYMRSPHVPRVSLFRAQKVVVDDEISVHDKYVLIENNEVKIKFKGYQN